jgi:hypothetical protein
MLDTKQWRLTIVFLYLLRNSVFPVSRNVLFAKEKFILNEHFREN